MCVRACMRVRVSINNCHNILYIYSVCVHACACVRACVMRKCPYLAFHGQHVQKSLVVPLAENPMAENLLAEKLKTQYKKID